jgi:hypothetical protein
MTQSRKRLALALLIASVAGGAQAQTAREQRDPAEAYLQLKEKEFAASERAANARGLGGNVTALYNLLRDKGAMNAARVIGRSGDEQAKVRDALVRSVAHYLASAGVGPDDVTRAQRSGLDPLQAGVDVFAGTGTLYDSLAIAPIAVVARVSGVAAPAARDAFQRVTFTPVRVLKGAVDGPFTLQLPLVDSPDQPDGQYLLFLSRTLGPYRQAAGRPGNDGALAQVTSAYALSGGSYAPTNPYQNPASVDAAAVDAFVAKHAEAFRAGQQGGQK